MSTVLGLPAHMRCRSHTVHHGAGQYCALHVHVEATYRHAYFQEHILGAEEIKQTIVNT